jgi:hypothetical protein
MPNGVGERIRKGEDKKLIFHPMVEKFMRTPYFTRMALQQGAVKV